MQNYVVTGRVGWLKKKIKQALEVHNEGSYLGIRASPPQATSTALREITPTEITPAAVNKVRPRQDNRERGFQPPEGPSGQLIRTCPSPSPAPLLSYGA